MATEDSDGRSEAERLDNLEHRADTTDSKLDQILSLLTGGGKPEEGEQPGGRPGSVEEQVRAELERAKAEEAEAKAKADGDAAKDAERETLAQRLAKLEEAPPKQPQPRRQRVMWGPR